MVRCFVADEVSKWKGGKVILFWKYNISKSYRSEEEKITQLIAATSHYISSAESAVYTLCLDQLN